MKIHRRLRSALARAAASLALAPLALAQTSPAYPVLTLDHPWDAASSGTFTALDSGDFDGDGYLDLVQMRGGQLQIVLSPSSVAEVYTGISATAFLVVEDPAVNGDALLVATGTQLVRLVFNGTSWTQSTLSVSDAWGSVLHLRRRPIAALRNQVIGLASDGRTLLSLVDSGQGYEESASPLLVAPEPLVDLEVFDQNGDGVREMCLMDSDGLRVAYVSNPGAPAGNETWAIEQNSQLPGYSMLDAAVGSQNTDAREWVALLILAPNGTSQFITFLTSGGLVPELTSLPSGLGVMRMGTGDWTGDGPDDIALSWTSTQETGIVPNTGTNQPLIDPANMEVLPLSSAPLDPAPGQQAQPLLLDLDWDGDLDLVLSCQPTAQVHMALGQFFNARNYSPGTVLDATAGDSTTLADNAGAGPLGASVNAYGPTSWPVGTPFLVELEVSTWYMPTGGSNLLGLGTDYITGIDPNDPSVFPLLIAPRLASSEVLTTVNTFTLADFYFFRTRFVKRVGGQVVWSTPHQTYGYHAQGYIGDMGPGDTAQEQLFGWGGSSPYNVDYNQDPAADDYVTVGGGTVLPKLPPRPSGTVGGS
jgi:hypothetical protein